MHFTILYVMENEELKNISLATVEERFSDQFCYCCGETNPPCPICDWFQIGGRWNDQFWATKGIKGEAPWADGHPTDPKQFSIVEIKNLIKPIDVKDIFGVASRDSGNCIQSDWGDSGDKQEIAELINKINNKEIKGCIALIDCHD